MLSKLHLLFLKFFVCKNIKFKNLKLPFYSKIKLRKNSHLFLGDNFRARGHLYINIADNAYLHIGNNCFFNNNCSINCHKDIFIGDNTILGESILIYDHDHKFDYNTGAQTKGYNTAPVYIGNNCWIGSGTIILKGSYIEDNCLIAAGSIINGKIKEKSLVYNQIKTIQIANYSNI